MSKQPPPAPTASAVGPCPTVIKIVGRPSTGSLPSTIAPPDHPLRVAGDHAISEIKSIIGHQCRQRNPYLRVNGLCRKRSLPSFRHYPFTRRFGFLGLHRRPMIDYFSYLFSEKSKFKKYEFTINVVWRSTTNVIWRSLLRRVSNVCKQLKSLIVSRASCLSP